MVDTTWRTSRPGECTVRLYLPRALELCPAKSLDTYHAGFSRLDGAYGPMRLDEVRPTDLELLRDRTRAEVGARKVDSARCTGRSLGSYDPDAHGHGAAENLVRAVRRFFRCAVADGVLASSPATELAAPRRPLPPERALTTVELADLYRVASGTGNDQELDTRLVRFIRHTACRREGTLNLTLDALRADRPSVTVVEKFGVARELPLAGREIAALVDFARGRGARCGADAVFRYRNGRPISYRRFDNLFGRLDRYTEWSEQLDVGAHWIRHTTLTDVAAVAGLAVAAAYAGHRAPSKNPTLRYVSVGFEDLARAYDTLFGLDG